MPVPTLAGLLVSPSRDSVKAQLLIYLQRPEFGVTDWHPGAVIRTQLELETEVLEDLVSQVLPIMVAGGYLDSSDKDWLTDLAKGWYARERLLATVAQQTVTLACAAGFGPYNIVAGLLALRATDGRIYYASSGGTLSGGGSLAITAIAESPGQARGLISSLATPLQGVTIQAAAIRIISGVSQFGSDEEPDATLLLRCDARWPDDDAIETEDRVATWAKAASTEITRVKLAPDETNSGGVVLTVAGVSGAVSSGAVTAANAYVADRAPITDYVTTQNATNLVVNAGGTVIVPATLEVAAKAAADAAWIAYLAAVQIGAKVYAAELVQAVMDAGAIDFQGATVNGSGTAVTLGSAEVPVAGTLPSALTWVAI
jgi:hypothetical protein